MYPSRLSSVFARRRTRSSGPVFYAIGIIITAYLPIFTLESVEGRLFKPMAWTVAFALLGALIFSMVMAPVLSSFLFREGMQEWRNPLMTLLTTLYRSAVRWAVRSRWFVLAGAVASLVAAAWLMTSGRIGSEFLPHLDEGAIWVRGTLGAEHRTHRRHSPRQPGSSTAGLLSGGHRGHQPGGTARRRNRYHRLL